MSAHILGPGLGLTGLVTSLTPSGSYVPLGLDALAAWHDAQNVDLSNNSTLVNLQALGTWKNASTGLVSIGAAGDIAQATAGSKPRWDAVAVSGKIGNRPAVECIDGLRAMASSAFTTIPQPYQVAFVWRPTKATVQVVTTGGGSAGITPQIWTAAAANLFVNAKSPAAVVDTGMAVTANTFHTAIININGASSFVRVDGVQSANFDVATTTTGFVGSLILFNSTSAGGATGAGFIGYLCDHRIYATPQNGASLEADFAARWGVSFPN